MYALMTARYGGKGQGQMFETDRAAQLDTALRNSERGDESRAVSYPVCVNGKCGRSSGEALVEFEFSVRGVVKKERRRMCRGSNWEWDSRNGLRHQTGFSFFDTVQIGGLLLKFKYLLVWQPVSMR